MPEPQPEGVFTLSLDVPVWDRFFTAATLVVIGTRDPDGGYDLAPKHMAMPLGWENFFGFMCTPRHATYRNAVREGAFTVTYPRAEQAVEASLAASPRSEDGSKPTVDALPTFAATEIEGIFLAGGNAFLECRLERTVEGFGDSELMVGRIAAAHVSDRALRAADRDDQQLLAEAPLLTYLPPGRYAVVRDSSAYPFPDGFKR